MLASGNPAVDALARLAGRDGGRVAIFNPGQLTVADPPHVLDQLGLDDLVIVHHLSSVGGYGSAVLGRYATATGTHGVEALLPSAVTSGLFDRLDLRALATVPEAFGTPRASVGAIVPALGRPVPADAALAALEAGPSTSPGPAGPWPLAAGVERTFALPGPMALRAVAVRLAPSDRATARSLRVLVRLRSGGVVGATVTAGAGRTTVDVDARRVEAGGGALDVELLAGRAGGGASTGGPVVTAVAVGFAAWDHNAALTSVGGSPAAGWFQLDGIAQDFLVPPRWRFAGNLGAMTLLRNERAAGAVWLQPPGTTTTDRRAPGAAAARPVAVWQDPVTVVANPRPALLVRSATYLPGWSATAVPAGPGAAAGTPRDLAVRRVGLLQGVDLPAGHWIVTWHYRSTAAEVGLLASAIGLIGTATALAWHLRRRRRGRPREPVASTP